MQDFDILHATKVDERKWGWHPFYHVFTSIHAFQHLTPTFPWAHNQEEATSLYDDVVCNMKRLQMFDPMPWCTRFLKLYLFSRGLQSTLVHSLSEATQSNKSRWFSKGSHSRQWLAIFWMIEEEGRLLFTKGVGSLASKVWQTHAIHASKTLFSSNDW